ncbi:MAG: hypothetical protein P4L33_20660 [Capsulimonadaceae bacterium]|nr:hypothetical protein [Capsulimonadaceae bacterium]
MHAISQYIDPIQNYFFSLYSRVPQNYQPYVSPVLIVVGILLYIWALVLLGRWCENKGQRFWLGVWLGILTGPLVGAIFVAYIHDGAKSTPKRSRSRGTRRKR